MMMNEPLHFTGLRGKLSRDAAAGQAHELALRRQRAISPTFPPTATISRRSCANSPPDEPLMAIGLGSNLLVRDGGVRGAVVLLHNPGGVLAVADGLIYAEAGVASPKLARFAAMHGCAEAEFLAGVPGTVGGALAMNAGCYGGETWRHVARVEVLLRDGELRGAHARRLCDRLPQRASLPSGAALDGVFTAAWFRFPHGDGGAGARAHQGAAGASASPRNRSTCPTPAACSAIPPGDHAARLIEQCGLKGLRHRRRAGVRKARQFHRQPERGGDRRRHRGADRARGKRRSCDRTGVRLEPEVRIVGEHAS